MAYVLEDIIDRFNGPWEEIGSGDAPAANPPETVSGLGARPEASVIRGKGTGAIGTKTFRLRGGVWVADVDANATASDAASAYDEDVQEILAPPAADTVSVHAAWNDNDVQPIITFTNPTETMGRNLRFAFGAAWAASPGGDLTVTGAKDQFGATIAPFTVASNPSGNTDTQQIVKDLSACQITFGAGAGGAGHTCSCGVGLRLGLKAAYSAPGTLACDSVSEVGSWKLAAGMYSVEPTTPPNGARNYYVTAPKTGSTSTVTITPA